MNMSLALVTFHKDVNRNAHQLAQIGRKEHTPGCEAFHVPFLCTHILIFATTSNLSLLQTFVENASEAMKAQKQREKEQDVNNNNKRVYLRDPSPGNQTLT